jgi:hypothetical protein
MDAADALLVELAETGFSSFLTDPLAPFDSKVAILNTDRMDLWCEPKDRIIAITLGMIETFEFIAAHAALRRMAVRISEHLEQRFSDPAPVRCGGGDAGRRIELASGLDSKPKVITVGTCLRS